MGHCCPQGFLAIRSRHFCYRAVSPAVNLIHTCTHICSRVYGKCRKSTRGKQTSHAYLYKAKISRPDIARICQGLFLAKLLNWLKHVSSPKGEISKFIFKSFARWNA